VGEISGSINEVSPTTKRPEYNLMAIICAAAESRVLIKKKVQQLLLRLPDIPVERPNYGFTVILRRKRGCVCLWKLSRNVTLDWVRARTPTTSGGSSATDWRDGEVWWRRC